MINANAATKLVIVTSLPHLVQSCHQEFPLQKAYHKALYQARLTYNNYPRHRICLHLITVLANESQEYDWQNKWYECFGQSLYYGMKTGNINGCK
jgi:hypothetical protein